MSRRPVIPEELASSPFVGREAIARGLLTRHHLKSPQWVRLLRGIYVRRGLEALPHTRLAALCLLCRDADLVVCGRTAAWLHGVWQPWPGNPVPFEVTRRPQAAGEPLTGARRRRLTMRDPPTALQHPGWPLPAGDVTTVGQLAVTTPLRTCFDLMRERGLVEAVVVADAFLHQGSMRQEDLAVYCADRRRWPGIRQARQAVALANADARSPQESRLRLVLVLAGLPEPLVNIPIMTADGGVLAVPDLLVIGRRTAVIEFDGGYHDELGQQVLDRRRQNRLVLSRIGPVLRYDADALRNRKEAIVQEVEQSTGVRSRCPLQHADFRRPPRPLAW